VSILDPWIWKECAFA